MPAAKSAHGGSHAPPATKSAHEGSRSAAPAIFFCTSRGAMCAGSAQVTLIELRRSCYTGCIPTARKRPPNSKTTTAQKDTKKGSNLLRNSRGLAGIVKRGETGATNSAMRSVYLVPQQTRLHMSNPVSNLIQAAGDTPTSPSFGWKRGQVLLQCSARALGRLQCARHWQVL